MARSKSFIRANSQITKQSNFAMAHSEEQGKKIQQQQQHNHHDTRTAFEPLETPQYEHDYFQHLRTNSDLNYKRSQDLEDYLNMEIE